MKLVGLLLCIPPSACRPTIYSVFCADIPFTDTYTIQLWHVSELWHVGRVELIEVTAANTQTHRTKTVSPPFTWQI